jgi:Cu-Zn family superoxide dismutase
MDHAAGVFREAFMRFLHLSLFAGALLAATSCSTPEQSSSASIDVPMTLVSASGAGPSVGSIVLRNEDGGVGLALHLHGLPPGDHGFHMHDAASCAPMANAAGEMAAAGGAGGHFDPGHTGHHEGPSGAGHMGDLPVLHVDADGSASQVLVAPHIHSVDEMRGHALIIHAGGDNYSDAPAPLGGGGARIVCGVVG